MGERPNAPRCARTREPAIGDEYAAKLARGVVGALAREPVPQRGQVPGEDPFAETWTAPSPQAISRWRRALAMQDKSGLRLATADGVVVPPPVPPVAMHDAPDLRALETWAMETDRPAIATALKRDRLGMVEMAGGSGVSLIDPADLARLTLPARAWGARRMDPQGWRARPGCCQTFCNERKRRVFAVPRRRDQQSGERRAPAGVELCAEDLRRNAGMQRIQTSGVRADNAAARISRRDRVRRAVVARPKPALEAWNCPRKRCATLAL